MSYDDIPALMTQLVEEQRRTTEAVICLAETLAGIRAKATQPAEAPAPKPQAAVPTVESRAPSAAAAPTVESRSDVTREQVSAAVLKLVKVKGRDAALSILAAHGASKVPELDPSAYVAVYQAATEAA